MPAGVCSVTLLHGVGSRRGGSLTLHRTHWVGHGSQGGFVSGQACPKLHSAALPGKKATLEALVLEALLDLVDRHWSGHRSLHSSEAFLGKLAQRAACRCLCPLLGPGPLASLDLSPASLPSGLRGHPEGPAHGVWVLGRSRRGGASGQWLLLPACWCPAPWKAPAASNAGSSSL